MRVVVTGGSGRVGRWVVRHLAETGHEVTNLDRVNHPELGLPGSFCRVELAHMGDVYDAMFQFQPDAVVHLAANPSMSGQARVDVFEHNVMTTYNVMQVAGDLGVRRVVYASSEMATGLLTDNRVASRIPFDESERYPSSNAYALSKYMCEVMAESRAVRYPATAFVGLRIANVISPDGYERVREEWDDSSRNRRNYWSYIDARDVGTACRATLEGESSGHEIFLITAADTRHKRGLRELMAEHYPGYDRIAPDHDDYASAFDCSKMARFFGWKPAYSWRQILSP